MPRWLVLLNRTAGALAGSDASDTVARIRAGLARHGIEAVVRPCEGGRLRAAARAALAEPFDAIVAGGGDGTLGAVADVMIGADRPFGGLPLGTFNHFARDLGLPLDLDAAVEALATGEVREVPVGEVNGTVFLNFAAVGLHPRIVAERERLRRRGRNRWLALAVAFARALRRPPLHRVVIRLPDRRLVRLTPSVVVCNNPYQMRAFGVEDASRPDRRVLNVYVAGGRRPSDLVRLMLRAVVGRIRDARGFEVIVTDRAELRSRRRQLRVSIDGEVVRRAPPLRFRIAPRPLRVIAPR